MDAASATVTGGNATVTVADAIGNDSVAPTVLVSETVGDFIVAERDVVLLTSTVWDSRDAVGVTEGRDGDVEAAVGDKVRREPVSDKD
jgi:hypothetical protein